MSISCPIAASPSTAEIAASTSLSAICSDRIASHCPALASNQLAADARANYIIHTGDFGFYDDRSLDRIADKYVYIA